jgi:hypothetical protein
MGVFAAANDADKAAVLAQIPKMHARTSSVCKIGSRCSIAAENRNFPQGPEHMAKLAQDAGFAGVKLIPTSGKPGVFGKIDAGAKTTMAITSCDVKQFVPRVEFAPARGASGSEGRIGTVCMGRGAVNQKGRKIPSSVR